MNDRYLFNCGEGTQRLAHEHKVKLSRLDHIFITNKTWMNIGGLPGLSLTLQDVGVPHITLHGPEGLVSSILIAVYNVQAPNFAKAQVYCVLEEL